MTKLQSRQPPEPEVFDALNPSPMDSPTNMLEDGIAETTSLSIVVTSSDQAADYSYAPLESSNGSLVHEGSQDFTGLQGETKISDTTPTLPYLHQIVMHCQMWKHPLMGGLSSRPTRKKSLLLVQQKGTRCLV